MPLLRCQALYLGYQCILAEGHSGEHETQVSANTPPDWDVEATGTTNRLRWQYVRTQVRL